MLTRHDLPRSWVETPHEKDSSRLSASVKARLSRCAGEPITSHRPVASVTSQDFRRGTARVFSAASRFATEKAVRSDVRSLHGPRIAACLQQVMRAHLRTLVPAGVVVSRARVTFEKPVRGMPRNVVGTLDIQLAAAGYGRSVAEEATMTAIATGRTEAEVDTEGLNSPVPVHVRNRLITAVARRLSRA